MSSSPAEKASTLDPLATLSPSNLTGSPAWSASFSIDGKYLAVCFGNPDTHVKVWEHKIIHPDTNKPTASSASAVAKEEKMEWELIATIREDLTRTVRAVAFAPTSSTLSVPILATASFDGKVMIWEHYPDNNDDDHDYDNNDDNLEENSSYFEPIAQLEGHENEIKCLAWNATGSLLASCGRDKTIWIWECFLPGTVGGNETASNNPMLGNNEEDQGEFECLAVLQGHEGDIKSIVFGPSHSQWGEGEEVLYSASYDDTIKIWAEESGDWYCAATLGSTTFVPQSMPGAEEALPTIGGGPVHTSTVWSLGLTPGGVRLFSGSEDGSMAIWKMYTASERKRLFPRATNNNNAAVCSTDGLWNCVGKLPDAHSSYAVLTIDCAPSRAGHGRIVSGGGDNCINIYREESGSSDAPKFSVEAMAVNAHAGDVNCVMWHPRDGTCLVSCGDDGAVKLWKYRRG